MIRDKVAGGLSEREAEAAARRELGNELLVREVTRDAWGWGWLERLLQDVRYGARLLRRSPGFTATAALTLALGVGANTAVFSVANATLLQPLPFHEPDRLVLLWEGRRNDPTRTALASVPMLRDWQERSRSFDSLSAFDSAGRGYNVSRGGETQQVIGCRVTSGFFETLGVAPLLGRTFAGEEETFGPSRLVVLSHGLWLRAFGGDVSVVGETVRLDGQPHTILGVMPPEFRFQFWGSRELWVLAGFTENDRSRNAHSWISLARLAERATVASARAEMEALGTALAAQHPESFPDGTVRVVPAAAWGVGELRSTFRALAAIVGFVLLIACVNVANLSLARATARQHELQTRHALGAGRGRLARQLLTESLLLAALGGAAGLLLAAGLVQILPDLLPASLRSVPMRPPPEIHLDARVLVYTMGIASLAGVIFGTAPAFYAARRTATSRLARSARGASSSSAAARLRGALVVAEVALALVVLAGAGLMMATMRELLAVDPGLDPDDVLVMFVSLPQEETFVGPPDLERFCADLEEQAGAVPGVVSVGAVAHLPLTGSNAGRGFLIEGRPLPAPADVPLASYSVACPNALRTLGVPLVEGREFDSGDVLGATDVVIVNQTLAERHWPGESAVGRRFKLASGVDEQPWLTVVGVYRDVRHWGLSRPIDAAFLRPYPQAAWPGMAVVARTRAAPRGLEEPVEAALGRVAPDSPVAFVTTMREVVDRAVDPWRFPLLALSAFACVALLLAAVGVAGVIGYSVSQRTREIGVRVSLGARPGDIARLVVARGVSYALLGSVLGALGSGALLRLMDHLLFGVTAGDPRVLAGAAVLLFTAAVAASLFPARQATRVDPVVALRSE